MDDLLKNQLLSIKTGYFMDEIDKSDLKQKEVTDNLLSVTSLTIKALLDRSLI